MQLEDGGAAASVAAVAASGSDYALVRRAIALLSAPNAGAPAARDLADGLGVGLGNLERALRRWCGLTPVAFAHALSREYICALLAETDDVLAGSGGCRGRTHAFAVRVAETITDDARRRGAGLEVAYGFHASPFGEALVMTTEAGVCGLAFADESSDESRRAVLNDMMGRWPRAAFREAPAVTGPVAMRVFGMAGDGAAGVVPVVLVGTPFDLRVWEALLLIPIGRLVSYAGIAHHLGCPTASRAVGTANGRNPISFIVPCHRALRGDGTLGGYYWGLERKRALIAWEAGRAQQGAANSCAGLAELVATMRTGHARQTD